MGWEVAAALLFSIFKILIVFFIVFLILLLLSCFFPKRLLLPNDFEVFWGGYFSCEFLLLRAAACSRAAVLIPKRRSSVVLGICKQGAGRHRVGNSVIQPNPARGWSVVAVVVVVSEGAHRVAVILTIINITFYEKRRQSEGQLARGK